MAVSSVALRHPLSDHLLPVNKDMLVVGGGVTGMNAALSLADRVSRYIWWNSRGTRRLAKKIRKTLTGEDVQAYMKDLIEKTLQHERIEVLTGTMIVDHKGMPGMFTTGLQIAPRMYYRQIKHGITIMAPGRCRTPEEYLLDKHKAVMTQLELDSVIEK